RMSLGGVHDEAEIRGHRKTYVGAMPGKILQNIRKARTSNPVFILDEIDKVRADFRDDPSSALLEVLDPEQNNAFTDNFLEVEYDLSKVLFIATANTLDSIHPALRDRMEIIEITGYTQEEKVEIAMRHLVPKQLKEHGLKSSQAKFTRKISDNVIEIYNRETSVRNLERKVGARARHNAKSVAQEDGYEPVIYEEMLRKVLGVETYNEVLYQNNETAGLVTGLGWTQT